MKITVNDSELQRKLRAAIQATPQARQEALKIMVTKTMQAIVGYAPRDTNAYGNAWAQAATTAGLGAFPMPPLNTNSKLNRKAEWYVGTVQYWKNIVRLHEEAGRTGKWPEDARAKLVAAEANLASFNARNAGRLAIPVLTGQADTIAVPTISEGGTGQMIQVSDRTYYRFTNREPHARGVEARTQLVQRATAPFRALGMRGMPRVRFLERWAIASGLAVSVKGT